MESFRSEQNNGLRKSSSKICNKNDLNNKQQITSHFQPTTIIKKYAIGTPRTKKMNCVKVMQNSIFKHLDFSFSLALFPNKLLVTAVSNQSSIITVYLFSCAIVFS